MAGDGDASGWERTVESPGASASIAAVVGEHDGLGEHEGLGEHDGLGEDEGSGEHEGLARRRASTTGWLMDVACVRGP